MSVAPAEEIANQDGGSFPSENVMVADYPAKPSVGKQPPSRRAALEKLPRVDRVVLIPDEAAGETAPTAAIDQVPDEPGGSVTRIPKRLGDGPMGCVERPP